MAQQLYKRNGVKAERTGERDQWINDRHREWGFNAPAFDLDFAMVEYSYGEARAVVEYKRFTAEVTVAHPSHKALAGLYNSRGEQIPAWLAKYWPDTGAFRVHILNPPARKLFGRTCLNLTERQYVARLFEVRGFDPEVQMQKIEIELGDTPPPTSGRP